MSDSKLLVTGNESINFGQPEIIWYIESGAIALFAVPHQAGIDGSRRYLFTVKPGAALFAIDKNINSQVNGYKILAISMEETVLLAIKPQEHQQNPTVNLLELVNNWCEHISRICNHDLVIPPLLRKSEEIPNWENIQIALDEFHSHFLVHIARLEQEKRV